MSAEAIIAIMQTNVDEALGYISYNVTFLNVLLIVVIFIFFLVILKNAILKLNIDSFCNDSINNSKFKYPLIAILLMLCISIIYKGYDNYQYSQLTGAISYINQFHEFEDGKQARLDDLIITDQGQDGLYVLVIGESQNRDFMGAYGYEKETTPWLSSMADYDN